MKLWKKFCDLDIIGKIYVLILLFIVIIATITVITRYTSQEKNTIETNQENIEQQNVAIVEDSQNVNSNLVIEKDNNTVAEETEISNQHKENREKAAISVEKQNTNSKKETITQTSNQPTEKVNNTPQSNQKDNKKTDASTQKENKPVEEKKETVEQKVKLDFTKYDRYTSALNGGYTCFKKSNNEIAKLKGLIDQTVSDFGYKNVKIIQNKDIAMSTSYFTANRTNVENKVYNSEDFTVYYYAEAEYTLSSQGVENFIQYRSYITVR